MPDDGLFDIADTEEDALYLMANLFPRDTGLPRVVWVSEKGHARHDVRVKVSGQPGERMRLHEMAVLSVRPTPQLMHGALSADEVTVISAWIELNEAVLVDYWNGDASTADLIARLRRAP